MGNKAAEVDGNNMMEEENTSFGVVEDKQEFEVLT